MIMEESLSDEDYMELCEAMNINIKKTAAEKHHSLMDRVNVIMLF